MRNGIKVSTLAKAKPQDVRRLAKYLKLIIDHMSDAQVRRLVSWRLSPNRFNGRGMR